MTHQLLFKHGALSAHQVDSVRTFLRQGYQYGLFMSDLPPYEWRDKNFELFQSTGEDCMGNEYLKMTQMWGCSDAPNGQLFFLKSKADFEAVLRDYSHLVIDAQPFQTVIEPVKEDLRDRIVKAPIHPVIAAFLGQLIGVALGIGIAVLGYWIWKAFHHVFLSGWLA